MVFKGLQGKTFSDFFYFKLPASSDSKNPEMTPLSKHKKLSGRKDLILTQGRKPKQSWMNFTQDSPPKNSSYRTKEEIGKARELVKNSMEREPNENLKDYNKRVRARELYLRNKFRGNTNINEKSQNSYRKLDIDREQVKTSDSHSKRPKTSLELSRERIKSFMERKPNESLEKFNNRVNRRELQYYSRFKKEGVIRKTRSPMELEIAREEIKREMKRYPNESL